VLEYSKIIGNLLGNPDSPPAFTIEDPKTILKVSYLYVFFLLFSW
jgi:nuclear pore complex protein Nup85